MAILGLNLPTDIPWQQVCVTEDMMATEACEVRHPPKWQSSIAISKYVPEEEYQVYPGRQITYLKVTCSITGYQPRDKEVEGRINFRGTNVQTVNNIDSLLESYLPCTGALIQVAVSPDAPSTTPFSDYPYFMDFQPKKRELYEMVTETGERSSRSVESLQLGKASGTSESLEVLDVDQGSSSSVGGSANVSYAGMGVGGSFNSASGNQGQWGTKQLGGQESSVSRSTDESRERRETESHTTQLSQMYHLLDSFHQGTNRALFYVQPRPHILETPTGFVRGPRGVDGIQEFFLVVNQPKDQGFSVSVRMDTSHLTVVPIMGYDRSRTDTVYCKAIADTPTDADIPDARQTSALVESDGDRVGTIYYNCFKRVAHTPQPYAPPPGFRIDVDNNGGYLDQVNIAFHGSSDVLVDPAGNSLTVNCDAVSHVCKYEDDDIDVGYWSPDNVEQDAYKWPASAERDILVYLVSREPTVKTGERNVLVITTRELCCGDSGRSRTAAIADVLGLYSEVGKRMGTKPSGVTIAAGKMQRSAIRESDVAGSKPMSSSGQFPEQGRSCDTPSYQVAAPTAPTREPARTTSTMTAREANELSDAIRTATIQSAGSRRREASSPLSYMDTDLFHQQLRRQLIQTGPGRLALGATVRDLIGADSTKLIEKYFRVPIAEITGSRISEIPSEELAKIAKIGIDEARRLKMRAMGVVFHDETYTTSPTGPHPKPARAPAPKASVSTKPLSSRRKT
jgi:hypothetical protein